MINKSYYDNMSSKNILVDYKQKDLTGNDFNSISYDTPLDNMILNSNLDNGSIIK